MDNASKAPTITDKSSVDYKENRTCGTQLAVYQINQHFG